MKKKMLSLALALMMCLGLTVPALAAGTSETFVHYASTITVHNVLRSETASFPYVVYDYDEDDELVVVNAGTWDLIVYIVDSEDYVTFDVKANPGFEYSDNASGAPSGGNYASMLVEGYRWDPAGGFAIYDSVGFFLTEPGTMIGGYPYGYDETTWQLDESSRAPYLLALDDDWFMTESDFAAVTAAQPSQPTTPTTPAATNAVLSPQGLKVDGKDIQCEKYNIADRNYFKLRDLAQLLSGTGSQFEVGYDEATATVSITTGKAYTPNGTELLAGVDNSASAQPSNQAILINGEKNEKLTVYNIGGSNFFQLRELGEILGFDVDYDQDTNTAIVNSVQK